MRFLIPLAAFAVLHSITAWLRAGHGGKVGQAVRNSDWQAWRWTMDEKERELAELRKVEPRR